MQGKSIPWVLSHTDKRALPVVGGAELATAKGTSSIRSAGRADIATAAVPEALGPGVYGGAGGTSVRMAATWQGLAQG